jgi:hypothetical protein
LLAFSYKEARAHAIIAAVIFMAAVCVAVFAGRGNRSIAGPIKGADFLQFYTSGHLVRTHQSAKAYDIKALHEAQVVLVPESNPELYPPVYPPQTALLFAPFSIIPYRAAVVLWIVISAFLYVAIVRNAWVPVVRLIPDRTFVLAAAVAFPPFASLLVYGQVTILVLVAFWAAWIALERGNRFLAGCALGLLAVKPQFGLVLAAVMLACREWSIIMGAVTSISCQLGAVIALLGGSVLKAYFSFIPTALRNADLLEPKPYQSHSLRAVTRLAPSWADVPLWVAASVAVVFVTIRVWRSTASWRVRMGVMILASVLVNPHLIIYDAAILVLPLLWLGAYLLERGTRRASKTYWTLVYWLAVALLLPTAAIIRLQISVFLMLSLLYLVTRAECSDGALIQRLAPSSEVPGLSGGLFSREMR